MATHICKYAVLEVDAKVNGRGHNSHSTAPDPITNLDTVSNISPHQLK